MQDLFPGQPHLAEIGSGEVQDAFSEVQDQERGHHGAGARDHGRKGRSLEPHRRQPKPAEDENGVQDEVRPGRAHHDEGGDSRVATGANRGIGNHWDYEEHDPEIPDPHVVPDKREDIRPGSQQRKQGIDGQNAGTG